MTKVRTYTSQPTGGSSAAGDHGQMLYKTSRGRYLLGHLAHRLNAGPVQMVVVLSRLDELVLLDVLLHLLSGNHKVIIPTVHLVLSLGPGGI